MNALNAQRKQFFNQRAETWLDNHYKNPDTDLHDRYADRIRTIVSFLGLGPDSRILDAGCGSGVLVPYLLEHLSDKGRLIEMDFSDQMILANRNRHTDERISFICCDAAQMKFETQSLDAVICFAAFPHFSDPEQVLNRMSKSLRPQGRLVIGHLMSSSQLAAHHHSHTPVSRDRLPEKETMFEWITGSGLDIDVFKDEPGLYLLAAVKP
ncbi:class I SAM-dependent methyltransferase [uncultured Desulfobacter sp.]|uniref:class I SAM-dependent methyltransferase n=1 Tax=uncultured Desulfobacter sp. TaxID=240139 RepID=UPI002AAB928F|nr:class I SAM-dependent methyltransferase [uncultured Desulfobacter sp.]